MADPFNINKDNGLGEKDPFDPEIESLFSEPTIAQQPVQEPVQQAPQPELVQTNQEIDTLFSDTTPGVAQAQSLIQLRDDPQALDLFLGTAERIRKGQLLFNKQSWEDAQLNVKKFQDENQPKILEAEQKGNWMEMAKLATLGVGKVLGSYLQAGFGATNEDMEKAQQSLAARNFIGTIKDPNEAAKALELTSIYADELDAGKSITPPDQKPGMAFGTGPLTAKLGMNLAQAEEYLRDLESDRNKKLGTAGLRNFAIQSGDAFLPFVSIGDIVIDDENNPDQVARRAALTNKINEVVQKDYGVSTLSGAAIGSVGSFITVGSGAAKLLGRAAQIGDTTVKVPTILSRGATYATIGASQSFEGDPRNLSPTQRLASIFSEAAVLSLAEGLGNKTEAAIDNSVANYIATKALASEIPAFAPVLGSMGKVVATTVGETTSEELEAILRGQDPVEPFLQNLGVSFGIGVGMAGVGGVPATIRAAKMRKQANDRIGLAIEDSIKSIQNDKDVPDQEKQAKLTQMRAELKNPKFQEIFDAALVSAAVDPALAPETAKVAKENLAIATDRTVEDVLSKAVAREEAPAPLEPATGELPKPIEIGQAPQVPETPEQIEDAFNELARAFQGGAEEISLDVTPQNQAKIQWLEGQGRVFGERVGDRYVVQGVKVKNALGQDEWLGEKDPDEIEADLTDSILTRAEEINLSQEDYDSLEVELRNAKRELQGDEFLLEKLESIAVKYLGPDEGVVAVEKQLNTQQEKIEEEKPAQFKIDRINRAIASLEEKIRQSPAGDIPALEEQLGTLRSALAQEQQSRQVRGEEAIASQVQRFENEVTGLAPEVAEQGDVILGINNPENPSYQELQRLSPDPREDSVEALGQVFNLNNPSTVELLQSLGAIDENNRPLLSPAATLVKYLERKNSYLRSRALSGYQGMNIADEVSSATLNTFLLELRRGKSNISLSTIFNSRLRDFIRAARPRMLAGVGIGGARRVEAQIPGQVDFQALAESQGLNPNSAQVVNELLAEVDSTEVDFQAEQGSPVDIPSVSQRYEALAVIAAEQAAPFRQSLASDLEKLAFDSIVSDINVAAEARKINKNEADVAGVRDAVREKFKAQVTEAYRKAQAEENLPAKEAEVGEAVRAGDLTNDQIKPAFARLEKYIEDFVFDDAELTEVNNLKDRVQNTRRAQDLKKLDDRMTEILVTKLDENALDALSGTIFANLQNALDSDRISQTLADDYAGKFNKLEEAYNKALEIENPADVGRLKQLAAFRASLLKLNQQLLLDANLITTEEGIDEKTPETTETKKPAEKLTTDQRRKTSGQKFEELLSGKAARKPEAAKPKRVEERAPKRPAVAGRGPRAPRDGEAKALPANFVVPRQQQTLKYDEKSLSVLGEQVLKNLSPEQRQDVAAAIASLDGSAFESFYLANGPGTGKTRVLLTTGKYYLDRGFNVIYLTESEAVAPDWAAGTIGGSIEKDAQILGVPLAVRGSQEGLPIEMVPGRVLVSTYETSYLKKILPLVDKKTVVLLDEQHAGRNLFEKKTEGKEVSEAVLMDEIAQAAGKVMMASGTPIDRFDQLPSLRRLGIFAAETIEQLGKRLGFEKTYLSLSGKKTKKARWVPSIAPEEASKNLQNYLERLTGDGKVRSRSLKLDNVDVRFKDVPLTPEVIGQLEAIKNSYGGDQNENLSSRRSIVNAQKRVLEEFKVQATVDQAIDAMRRGRKPVIYVGYVSKEDSSGESVNPTAEAVEKRLLAINKDLKIAKMYSDSGQTKGEALALFNDEDADVLIATKEMGGTGIELDDKFGNSPREMIVMSLPNSGVQAAQLAYRVRRVDSASYPTIVFMVSEAEADRVSMGTLVDRLNFLDAFLGVGLDRLQNQAAKVNEATRIVDVTEPSAEELATAENTLRSIFGKDYADNTFTLRDEKGKTKQYSVAFSNTIGSIAQATTGDSNETDTITFNPARIIEFRNQAKSEKEFLSYVTRVALEETVHVETFRYFRELGFNPIEELQALGEAMPEAKRLAHARLYYSVAYPGDITSPQAQATILALANNPILVAAEAIRQIVDLDLAGGVIEQSILGVTKEDKKRAAAFAKELGLDNSKNVLARFGTWFDTMALSLKRGLGLAPNAIDRLAIKPAIEDAISRLRKLNTEFSKAAEKVPVTPITPGSSPIRPRPATTMDAYDLRIYRMIENHLEGLTEGVLGVSAAVDELRTVDVGEWTAALGTAYRRGLITKYERNLFRAAARPYLNQGRVSLALVANESLRIAEEQSLAGDPVPTEALIAIAAPAPVAPTVPQEKELNAQIEEAARSQRREPESVMMAVTLGLQEKTSPSPVLIDLLEHVGDLSNRAQLRNAVVNVDEKLRKVETFGEEGRLSLEQEIEDGYRSNAEYRVLNSIPELVELKNNLGKPRGPKALFEVYEKLRKEHGPKIEAEIKRSKEIAKQELKKYVEAHEKFNKPVTKLGKLGKDAAIALGNQNFDALRKIISEMRAWVDEYNKASPEVREKMFVELAPAPAPTPVATTPTTPTLPRNLAGAKPRYSFGQKQFGLKFANDVDRALYIVAQTTKSARDAEYLDFAMKATGLDEFQARAAGRAIRASIKEQARTSDADTLDVAQSDVTKPKAEAPAPQAFEITDGELATPPASIDSDLRKIKTNYENVENQLLGFPKEGSGREVKGFDETKYPYSLQLEISTDNGNSWTPDAIRGMNFFQAVERAKRNWEPTVQLRLANMVTPRSVIVATPNTNPAPYRVKVGDSPRVETTAVTIDKAVSNAIYRGFQNQEVINFNGRSYTKSGMGALVNAARAYGFSKLATRLEPQSPASPVSRLSPSKAIANITAKYKDAVREDVHKESLFEAWQRQSVPREEQFAAARDYINTHPRGFNGALSDFLSGNVRSTLPVQGALGFELARVLGPRAKADKYYESQLVDVMLLLSKKYGTEPGQAVDLWNALGQMSDNPEAMKIFIGRQIDSAVKGRLAGYAEEETEIAGELKDANRRAADSMAADSKTQSTLDKIAKLVELKKKQATFAEVEAAVRGYLSSQEALDAAAQFLGEDLGAGSPDSNASDADNIRLDPVQTKALSSLILQIIQRSENPAVTAASAEDIKRLILLVPALRDAKNQANVQRKLDLYFDGALAMALETIAAEALGEAQARERVSPPASFGEGRRRAQKAKVKAQDEAPIVVSTDQGSRLASLAEAFAESLQRRAAKLQEEPKKKDALELLVDKLRRDIAASIRSEGGLQPAYEPEPAPTEAEVLRDRIARYPEVLSFIQNTRDALLDNYSEEERKGLEPLIDEALDLPFTVSGLKRAISSLESIGGPRTNVRSLIRSSKGDIADFENKMLALLTENTNLDPAERQTVMGYLRSTMEKLIAQERKKALQIIKDRFEKRKERKTRKIRTALEKLIEATNLGVLSDGDLFAQMHSQLGLPELKESERNRLNQLIEDLPKYPEGRIRNQKVSEMYQYVKLVSPQVWGDLIVNYQTANVLAGLGTVGINAWSAFISNQLNAAILASVAGVKKVFGSESSKSGFEGTAAFYEAILGKDKLASKAALDTILRGSYSNSVDALTQELGGVNIWEAVLNQGEAFRYGKPGAVKPELPVRAFGQEFRIPLDSKFISSKYGIVAPFIWFGRAMAAGDAFNRVSAKKLYEMAEATNLAIAKGLKTEEEIEAEVSRLLNLSPEARARAEARALADAKQFGFENDAIQIQLRVEEILEQSRPDTEEVQTIMENARQFAARSAFTGDFEGLFGLIAESLTTFSAKFWPARLVIKFLRTGSNLANEVLNFMPVISTLRLYRGTGNFFGALKGTKYYKAPPVPGSVEHDLLVGKMSLGLIITAGMFALLKEAMDGEDDPQFMVHFKGPLDPAQREAFFAAGGTLRSIQYGRFKDGRPKFLSLESLPVGIAGPLLLVASIVETIRYEKRSKAETIVTGALMGGMLAMYGVLDMAALSGIRQIMSLTSPGPGQRDPASMLNNLTKVAGNITASLIPGYATLRDFEQFLNGITGSPSARPYQTNLLSTFAQTVPFAAKVGAPDLDHLGGNVKTQLLNSTPFLRRLAKFGVDSTEYNEGSRTPDAIHSKLISMFASNRFSLDWDAGPLKDFALTEMVAKAQKEGIPLTADDFFDLSRELTPAEKYEWLRRSGPIIQDTLAPLIPQLEQMSRNEFILTVRSIVNPLKRGILYQLLSEKNQQDILLKQNQ
jgi:hypothetical protein